MIEMLDIDADGKAQYFPAGYVGKEDVPHLLRYNLSPEGRVLGRGHTIFRVRQLYKTDRACLKEKFQQLIRRHDGSNYGTEETTEGSTET